MAAVILAAGAALIDLPVTFLVVDEVVLLPAVAAAGALFLVEVEAAVDLEVAFAAVGLAALLALVVAVCSHSVTVSIRGQ